MASSVRVRATLAAAAATGAALAVGAFGLVGLLRHSLLHDVGTTAKARALDVADIVRSGDLPSVLATPGEDATLVQVVDSSGQVISASRRIEGRPRMASFEPGNRRTVARNVRNAGVAEEGDLRVVALRSSVGGRPVVIYAGASLEAAEASIRTVTLTLAAGFPVLLAVVAGISWVLVGRALRPVEQIRAEVAAISQHDLTRRVPEPGSRDEIGRLAGTMNDMLSRLDASTRRQQRFVADASHELRSPLASLKAELEVSSIHPETTDWAQVTSNALDDVDRMERLTRDLLLLARADAHALGGRRDEIDLGELARDAATSIRNSRAVHVDVSHVDTGPVTGDATQLRRIVINLLDNAVRYAAREVRLEVRDHDRIVELVVEDDGPGVPEADRERIFERFTRLDEARDRDAGGSGLGLAIVRELVGAHGGSVTVSADGGGSRFRVVLPRVGRRSHARADA